MLASRPHLIRRHSPDRLPALHIAVARSSPEMVSLLLAHGADPNLQTDGRQTPWALAVRSGHHEVARLLR